MSEFIKCSRGDCHSEASNFFVGKHDGFNICSCEEHVDVFYRSEKPGMEKTLASNWRKVTRKEYLVSLVLAE